MKKMALVAGVVTGIGAVVAAVLGLCYGVLYIFEHFEVKPKDSETDPGVMTVWDFGRRYTQVNLPPEFPVQKHYGF